MQNRKNTKHKFYHKNIIVRKVGYGDDSENINRGLINIMKRKLYKLHDVKLNDVSNKKYVHEFYMNWNHR